MKTCLVAALLTLTLAGASPEAQRASSPIGVWNMKLRVGHIGEGIRPVLLEIVEGSDGLVAKISGMQGRMNEADEFSFADGTMEIFVGSYEYALTIDGDTITGTVTSPTGSQDVTGIRQDSLMFVGDEPPLLEKDWRGLLASVACAEKPQDEIASCTVAATPDASDLVVKTRREALPIENATEFADALRRLAGEQVAIHGWWVVDKIRIQTVTKWQPPAS